MLQAGRAVVGGADVVRTDVEQTWCTCLRVGRNFRVREVLLRWLPRSEEFTRLRRRPGESGGGYWMNLTR